jgi:hypothetical protein
MNTNTNTNTNTNKCTPSSGWQVCIKGSGLTQEMQSKFFDDRWDFSLAPALGEECPDGKTPVWLIFSKRFSKKRTLERKFLCGLEQIGEVAPPSVFGKFQFDE